MQRTTLLITFLSATVFTMGCKKAETPSQQLDKVQVKTAEAAHEFKEYTFAQKAEFTQQMGLQLAELDRELDQLAAKIEKANEAAKAEAKPKLQALRDQTAHLNKQLEEAKNATEPTWNEVKAGFRKGVSELKEGFLNARKWMSDKIAP